MQTLKLCHPIVGGIFRKNIWRRGYSKKFIGEKILRICGVAESKCHTFRQFDHSFKDLEYDTGIANLEGRELITDLYNDPPHVYMDTNKAANGVNVKSSINSRSEQIWKVPIKN